MKKLIYLLLLLPFLVSGQNMTSYINTNVRTVQPNPTKLANTFQALVDLDKAVNTSGTNAYTASVNAAITSYETGQIFHIKFVNANTTAVTLNINSIGVKTVKKDVSAALVSGDLPAGTMKDLYYDGTDLIIIGPVGSGGAGTVSIVASADGSITVTNPTTTVDLAVVRSPILTTARTIGTITGDATSAGSSFNGSANNTNALTLATVNSNVGSFGSATQSLTLTANAKGLITAVSAQTVTPAVGSITGLGTGVGTWLGTPSWANFNSAITGTAPYWSLANGGTLTGANTITQSGNAVSFLSTSIGITAFEGLLLRNTTAATNILDQWSPSIVLEGNGWQSTGATTSAVKYRVTNKTVIGSTNTQGNLSFEISKAGGAYSDAMVLSSSAFNAINLTVGPSGSGSLIASAITGLFSLATNKTNDANSTTALSVTSVYGSASGVSINNVGNFGPISSGTTTYSGFKHTGTINQSGTASGTIRIFEGANTLTSMIADKLIAFDWAPTGAGISTPHLGFRMAASGASAFFANSTSDAITASTRVDIRGIASNNILRLATSANTERFLFKADGSLLVGGSAGTSTYVLTSNGSGSAVTWTAVSGGGITAGTTTITSGTNTRVGFNDSGVYGEDAGLVYNKTNDALTVGSVRLHSTSSGGGNTFVGELSGNFTNSSNTSTGIGWKALTALAGGVNNTAIGGEALASNTSGDNNVGLGPGSLFDNVSGSRNSALGNSALGNSTGNDNIGIGHQAGLSLVTGNNNIIIGSTIDPPNDNQSDQLSIHNAIFGLGNSGTSTTISTGKIGIYENSPTSSFHVDGSLRLDYIAKTANYTATVSDYLIDCTSNSFTVTLPTAVGITGRIYIIKNSGTATVITLATTSSQTIDGAAPGTLTSAVPIQLMSNGANWITIK